MQFFIGFAQPLEGVFKLTIGGLDLCAAAKNLGLHACGSSGDALDLFCELRVVMLSHQYELGDVFDAMDDIVDDAIGALDRGVDRAPILNFKPPCAIELAKRHKPTHILMDVRLEGDRDGVDTALAIQDLIETRIIYCTGSSEPATVTRINTDHPFEILFKPIDAQLLGKALLWALSEGCRRAHTASLRAPPSI